MEEALKFVSGLFVVVLIVSLIGVTLVGAVTYIWRLLFPTCCTYPDIYPDSLPPAESDTNAELLEALESADGKLALLLEAIGPDGEHLSEIVGQLDVLSKGLQVVEEDSVNLHDRVEQLGLDDDYLLGRIVILEGELQALKGKDKPAYSISVPVGPTFINDINPDGTYVVQEGTVQVALDAPLPIGMPFTSTPENWRQYCEMKGRRQVDFETGFGE